MTTKRIKLAKYTRNYIINNIISFVSSEKTISLNQYNILSIFKIETWIFIMTFLICVSILGIRKVERKTFLIDFTNSMFDHFECLIKNSSKLIDIIFY